MTLIWFLAGTGFALLELAFPALVVIFFALGAYGAALATLWGATFKTALVLFIVLSLTSLVLLRRHLRAVFGGRSRRAAEAEAHPMIGGRGRVTRALGPDAPGEVSVGGSFWRAVADEPLEPGRSIRVLGAASGNDLVLRVEPCGDAPRV